MKIIQTIIFAKRDKFTRERPRDESAIISPRIALFTINYITLGSTRWRRKSGYDDMDAREISRNDAMRDSPRLFAEYEEVCRYKYNAFLSHRFAPRCHRWLTQWHLKSLIVDVFLRRTRAKGTRISTSWNLLWHYNPFHVNAPESTRFRVERDRSIISARVLSFSFKPTEPLPPLPPPVDRDRVCFSSGPRCLPSRMTYEFKELESTARDGEVQCNE